MSLTESEFNAYERVRMSLGLDYQLTKYLRRTAHENFVTRKTVVLDMYKTCHTTSRQFSANIKVPKGLRRFVSLELEGD